MRNALAKALRSQLAVNPISSSKELREPLAGWRSFHSGRYRVVFKLYEEVEVIAVVGVGQHSTQPGEDIYRRLEEAARTGRLAEKILATLREFAPRKRK